MTRISIIATGLGLLTLLTASVGLAAPLQFTPVQACRVTDTTSGSGGILSGGDVRQFRVRGNGLGISGFNCNVPADARAVVLSFTAVPQGNPGLFMVVDASRNDLAVGDVSHLNWEAGTNAINNQAIVPLGAASASNFVKVYAGYHSNSQAHIILDVLGYYR